MTYETALRWNQVLKAQARDQQQQPPPPQQQKQQKRRQKQQQPPNSKYSSLKDSILFIPMAEQQLPISMPERQKYALNTNIEFDEDYFYYNNYHNYDFI